MKILFAGGGTGGHVMPILAVYREIKRIKKDAEFLWIGEMGGIEEKFAKENKIAFKGVLAGKMRRYFSFRNIIDIFKTPIGIWQAYIIVKKFKPDVLFSKGGYVSVPIVIACHRLKVPIILHESDVKPGKANLFLAKYADKIALGFEEARKYFKDFKGEIIVTGNPIRSEVLLGSTKRGYMKFGLEYDKSVLLVMGGSQGARKINELVSEVLDKLLEKWQVIHIEGCKEIRKLGNYEIRKLKYEAGYKVFEFLDAEEMGDALACADLVVSRAGANSLAEIAAMGRPSILIPYPYAAGDHQKLNAEVFKMAGASVVLDEKKLTGEKLLEVINNVDLERMGVRALGLVKRDAVKILTEIITRDFWKKKG